MKNLSLADKIRNPNYLDNLSDRRYRELMICKEILDDDVLESESSIQIAYGKARKKFIVEVLSQINPELAERALEDKVPIFNMLDMLEEHYK